jgi:hypothetical protein
MSHRFLINSRIELSLSIQPWNLDWRLLVAPIWETNFVLWDVMTQSYLHPWGILVSWQTHLFKYMYFSNRYRTGE